jgi:type VI secretion system secreted protein Hcp
MARRWSSAKVLLGAILGTPLTIATVVLAFSAATPAAVAPSAQGALVLTTSSGQQITVTMSSYRFGVQKPTPSVGSQSGGAGASKVSFNPFQITRKIDASSPLLFKACVNGTHFPKATLLVPTLGGSDDSFTFGGVAIQSIDWVSGLDGIDGESLDFTFSEIEIDYQTQPSSTSSVGWNRITNSPTNGPPPGA